jgi:hypothetical protein
LSIEKSTASLYLPTLKQFSLALTKASESAILPEIVELLESLSTELSRRLSDVEHDKFLNSCMLIDPRFKYDARFNNELGWTSAENELLNLAYKCNKFLFLRLTNLTIILIFSSQNKRTTPKSRNN